MFGYEQIIKYTMKHQRIEVLSSIKQEIIRLVEQNSHGLDTIYQDSALACTNLQQYLEFTVHEFQTKQAKMDCLAGHSLKLLEMVMTQLQQNNHLQTQIQNITNQQAIKDNIIHQLQHKLQQTQKCNKEYKTYCAEYEKILEHKEKETDQLSGIVGHIQNLKQQQINKADGEVGELKARIQYLTHQVKEYDARITEFQAILENSRVESHFLKQHISQLTKENQDLHNQRQDLCLQIRELQFEKNSIAQQMREVKDSREILIDQEKSSTFASERKEFLSKVVSIDRFNPQNSQKSISPRQSHKELYKIGSIDRFSSMSSLFHQPEFLKNILPDSSKRTLVETRSIGVGVDFLPFIPEILSPIKSDYSGAQSVSDYSTSERKFEIVEASNFLIEEEKKNGIQFLKEQILYTGDNKEKRKRPKKSSYFAQQLRQKFIPIYEGCSKVRNYSNLLFEYMFNQIVKNRIKK